MTTFTDMQLVEVARNGSHEALSILYERHLQFLLKACRIYAGGPLEPMDLVHEGWIRIINNLNRFTLQTSFRAWAATIVRNAGKDAASRRLCYQKLLAQNCNEVAWENNGGGEIHWDIAARRWLSDCMEILSPRQRMALKLHIGEGRSSIELAPLMGCAPSTVRSTCYFALKSLRAHVTRCPHNLPIAT